MSHSADACKVENITMSEKIETNGDGIVEKSTKTNSTNAIKSKNQTKRKRLISIEWMAASNETINEIDSIEDDFAFIQSENKRRKIAISAKRAENKENIAVSPSLNSKKPHLRLTKQPIDGKNGIETNKLRAKYDKIHTNTVQKMNAQAEQLRMEIGTLRTALANEQYAVRILR